jgi:hypothetical protein
MVAMRTLSFRSADFFAALIFPSAELLIFRFVSVDAL